MNAVVPYVGRLALRGAAARGAVNWKPYAMAAARVIGRAARGYIRRKWAKRSSYNGRLNRSPMRKRRKLFSRTHIGESVGTTSTKKYIQNSTAPLAQSTRTCYTLNLTALQQGTEISSRLRQHANIRGMKICMEIKNGTNVPLYFNCAVIAPKRVAETGIDALPINNFFRYQGTQRSIDFSNALSSLEFHCLPINTDDYTVLRHKRYRLITTQQATASWNVQSGSSFMNLDWYVPLKRQARYLQQEGRAAPTDGACYLAYWFDQFHTAAGQTPVAAATTAVRTVTYFREPRN